MITKNLNKEPLLIEYSIQLKGPRATTIITPSRSEALRLCKENNQDGYLKYYGPAKKRMAKWTWINKKAKEKFEKENP